MTSTGPEYTNIFLYLVTIFTAILFVTPLVNALPPVPPNLVGRSFTHLETAPSSSQASAQGAPQAAFAANVAT
ncbi:hypothetical protein GGX14DRAFT_553291 [Mycena pura]|uniref:Uncharacterized protein n=1 Tax=Mycena pura TaxID=153505 RepID=A0AAD6YUB5_9AGAR|nr:hypothetical protein GGX14DRAFT_553291 [Mycena pura]